MKTILFVCTGNTCRSPMAEAITRHWIDQGGLGDDADVFVASAGVGATEGAPLTPETLRSLEELGISHQGTSKPLSAGMIRNADLVLCMTRSQQEAAQNLVADDPAQQQKVQLLDPSADLDDPVGRGQRVYDSLAGQLRKLIPKRLKEVIHA